ncbi:MAG TPA: autotransporter-associated beta strand repeat-containing protein [Chthoniobacteraceae bacterium]|nr:autotransporter-associated beta strand repeat-containing protein [Chthoniobacteraceae bacterium]
MKPNPRLLHSTLPVILFSVFALSPLAAQVNGDWVQTAPGNYLWETPENWGSAPLIPGGIGSHVRLESALSGLQRIGVGAGGRTVGILDMGDTAGTFAMVLEGTGGITFERSGGAALNITKGGANQINTGITLHSNLTINHQTAYGLTLAGSITGTGGITQSGTGTVALSASTNTFSGGYALQGGTVSLNGTSNWFGTGSLVWSGGIVHREGSAAITNQVEASGNISRTGTGILTFSNAVTLAADTTLTTAARTDISGSLSGAHSLTKNGANILNFYGSAKTYSGGFTLNEGTVLAQINTAFGTGTLRLNGGTLSNENTTATFTNVLQLNGNLTLAGTRSMTFSGSTTLLQDTALTVNNTGGVTLQGDITGDGGLIKRGTGDLSIRGTNSYTGVTEVEAGVLNLFGNNVLTTASEVRISGGTLSLVAFQQTIGALSVSSGSLTAASGAHTLTASSLAFTNSATVSLRLAGAAALTKSGAGTLTLEYSTGNTYTGGSTVEAGTLLIRNSSGSATGSGAVTITAGATLAGNGRIGGPLTLSGSLRPGESIGEITVANDVTWNAGDAWLFELGTAADSLANAASGGSTQDRLIISAGSFLKGSGSGWTFDLSGTGQIGWYELATWSGTTTFDLSDFQLAQLAPGLEGSFAFNESETALYLEVKAVPEPSTLALLLGALGLTAFCRHRL